ncbi:MAG TPA: hypothetical protein VFC82_06140 [Actinomycetaceae bacterium]|nr:hypothetical protein [Actinomycetaceae bacterium]
MTSSQIWLRQRLSAQKFVLPTQPHVQQAEEPRSTARGPAPVNAGLRSTAGLGIALAATAASFALARSAVTLCQSTDYWRVDAAIGLAIMAIGAVVAAWYAATGIGVALAIATRRGLAVDRWGAPLARRLSIGLAVTLVGTAGALPAMAVPSIPDDITWAGLASTSPRELVDQESGLMDDAPAPSETARTVPDDTATANDQIEIPIEVPPDPPPARAHVVRAGESLWSISADELPDGTKNSEVASRVADWVDANPELAANPDLILIGQHLQIPRSNS